MPNDWGYPRLKLLPEKFNKGKTKKIAYEIQCTINQYKKGNFLLILRNE